MSISSNKNKFIAFNLSDEILDDYHGIVCQISSVMPKFSPMTRDNLHMTVCFLGDVYRNLKQLNTPIKEKITELMNKINEINESSKISNIIFDSFELFGEKQNLIVAKFRFINANDKKKIINLKQYFSTNFFAPNENYFEPHITLGKILGANDSDKKIFLETIKPKLNKPKINVLNNLSYCIRP